jgi:small subunit ribosomal protein S5
VGDQCGKVGVGKGRGKDVYSAIQNGQRDAERHLMRVPLTSKKSIPHGIEGSFGATKIVLRPAAPGCGVIAGSSIRTVLELAGVKNILAKRLGSKNILNNARATVGCLTALKPCFEYNLRSE